MLDLKSMVIEPWPATLEFGNKQAFHAQFSNYNNAKMTYYQRTMLHFLHITKMVAKGPHQDYILAVENLYAQLCKIVIQDRLEDVKLGKASLHDPYFTDGRPYKFFCLKSPDID